MSTAGLHSYNLFCHTSFVTPLVQTDLVISGLTADRLAQLVEHRTALREFAGSNLDWTNTQGL